MLARFERFMEHTVEGGLRRLFSASLEPVQLAKAAARAMEQAQVIGPRGPEVPNVYELRVAPADLERFGDYRARLATAVQEYLVEYAHERRLRPVAAIHVEVLGDPRVRTGAARARARFAGLAPAEQHQVEAAIEDTRRLRLADLATARAGQRRESSGELLLTDGAGLELALEPRMEVVRLGRAADNDVVVASQRVSRYHSQLRWVDSGWLVYDLDSTNGTWLDDQRLSASQPRLLKPGSRLRLGDAELQVRAAAAQRGRD